MKGKEEDDPSTSHQAQYIKTLPDSKVLFLKPTALIHFFQRTKTLESTDITKGPQIYLS